MSRALEAAAFAALAQRGAPEPVAAPEPEPTGNPDIDALVRELGRPLSPNEMFNVQQGLPHDFTPPPPVAPVDTALPHESPEAYFARKAAG